MQPHSFVFTELDDPTAQIQNITIEITHTLRVSRLANARSRALQAVNGGVSVFNVTMNAEVYHPTLTFLTAFNDMVLDREKDSTVLHVKNIDRRASDFADCRFGLNMDFTGINARIAIGKKESRGGCCC